MDDVRTNQISLNGYAKPAAIGAAVGFFMLVTFGQYGMEILSLPFLSDSCDHIAAIPHQAKTLMLQAKLLQVCKSFEACGFWYISLPAALACLIRYVNNRGEHSFLLSMLAKMIELSLKCGLTMFLFGFAGTTFRAGALWQIDTFQALSICCGSGLFLAIVSGVFFVPMVIGATVVKMCAEKLGKYRTTRGGNRAQSA